MSRILGTVALASYNEDILAEHGFDPSGATYTGLVVGGYEYGVIELATGESFTLGPTLWTESRAEIIRRDGLR